MNENIIYHLKKYYNMKEKKDCKGRWVYYFNVFNDECSCNDGQIIIGEVDKVELSNVIAAVEDEEAERFENYQNGQGSKCSWEFVLGLLERLHIGFGF